MPAITFDTLKFANTLKEAGVPSAHAEAEAKAISEILEVNIQELASKRDLNDLKRDIDTRFDQVDSKIVQLEQRLIIKMGALMAVSIGIVAALVKLLFTTS